MLGLLVEGERDRATTEADEDVAGGEEAVKREETDRKSGSNFVVKLGSDSVAILQSAALCNCCRW